MVKIKLPKDVETLLLKSDKFGTTIYFDYSKEKDMYYVSVNGDIKKACSSMNEAHKKFHSLIK